MTKLFENYFNNRFIRLTISALMLSCLLYLLQYTDMMNFCIYAELLQSSCGLQGGCHCYQKGVAAVCAYLLITASTFCFSLKLIASLFFAPPEFPLFR